MQIYFCHVTYIIKYLNVYNNNNIILEPSALKTADIIVGDYDYFGPHLYNLPKVKWIQGTWAGLDWLWPHIKKDDPPGFPIARTSGDNFGQLMGEYVIGNIVFWERNYFQVTLLEISQQKILNFVFR